MSVFICFMYFPFKRNFAETKKMFSSEKYADTILKNEKTFDREIWPHECNPVNREVMQSSIHSSNKTVASPYLQGNLKMGKDISSWCFSIHINYGCTLDFRFPHHLPTNQACMYFHFNLQLSDTHYKRVSECKKIDLRTNEDSKVSLEYKTFCPLIYDLYVFG